MLNESGEYSLQFLTPLPHHAIDETLSKETSITQNVIGIIFDAYEEQKRSQDAFL